MGIGRDGKTRTHINGFGDHYSTFELHPYVKPQMGFIWSRNSVLTCEYKNHFKEDVKPFTPSNRKGGYLP